MDLSFGSLVDANTFTIEELSQAVHELCVYLEEDEELHIILTN
jgi:hypothetical protein